MGYHAVELLEQGIGNRVVGIKEDKVVDFDIDEALEMTKPFEDELYKIADVVSI
jgi:6-phosphofructokinase 1